MPWNRAFPAALIAAATMVLIVTAAGCDRTRPLPGSQPVVAAPGGSAAPATPAVPAMKAGGPVKADEGWKFTYDGPGASSVHLAGTFNAWSTSADPLKKGADGLWVLVKALPPGTHQYKFVVNGGEWKEDPANPNSTDDGYGGKNSVLLVP